MSSGIGRRIVVVAVATLLISSLATHTSAQERCSNASLRGLDTYEVFVLLDTWIRQVFVPSLPVNARLAIGSRNPPSPA